MIKDSSEEENVKLCWIPTKDNIWEIANIVKVDELNQEYILNRISNNEVIKLKIGQVHPFDPTHSLDLENICFMNNLHEGPMLDLLRKRFFKNKIYTYTGEVLISINPYKKIDNLYDNIQDYFDINKIASDSENSISSFSSISNLINEKSELEIVPHVYKIANASLRELCNNYYDNDEEEKIILIESLSNEDDLENSPINNNIDSFHNQSIIISGESGAGKTENSKYILNFLIQANSILKSQNLMQSQDELFGERLKSLLIKSGIVLEAFGNAKTVRNNNSSRFGKYIKIMYRDMSPPFDGGTSKRINQYEIYSAKTETFLLEKSRLVNIGDGERNYHIFYQLINGLKSFDPSLFQILHLDSAFESKEGLFKILLPLQPNSNNSSVNIKDNADDDNLESEEEFYKTMEALKEIGCSREEIREIFVTLAIILHLGDLNLSYKSGDDANGQSNPVSIRSFGIELKNLSKLMGVFEESFILCLTTQQLKIAKRASIKTKILSKENVKNNIEALMKWMYNNLFNWLVEKINCSHLNLVSDAKSTQILHSRYIGILDIFGFEILNLNSFEQLCINYTNERLQQHFNQYVFESEQLMYKTEGIEWSEITYQDNQNVTDLINHNKIPHGLFQILEEHSMLNRKPDDIALLNGFNRVHFTSGVSTSGGKRIYSRSKFGNEDFVIKHFAGEVQYSIVGFLNKNNDSIQEDLMELMNFSTNEFFKAVFKLDSTQEISKKMASSSTVSLHFRTQLDDLIKNLKTTKPNYVKCIKPNNEKRADLFESHLVMQQLRYSGVLEVVRIRREGFPIRMGYREFYSKYQILASGKSKDAYPGPDVCSDDEAKHCASQLLKDNLSPVVYQLGHSLIFLRDRGFELLKEAIKAFFDRHASKIQRKYQAVSQFRLYQIMKYSALIIEKNVRCIQARVKFLNIRNAAIKLKWFIGGKIMRKKFKVQYERIVYERRQRSSLLIQKQYRGFIQRKKFQIIYNQYVIAKFNSATKIQSKFRSFICTKRMNRSLSAALVLQKSFRRYREEKRFLYLKFSTILIQSNIRSFLQHKRYIRFRNSIFSLQRKLRTSILRNRFLNIQHAVRKLQGFAKMLVQKYKFNQVCLSNLIIQNWVRYTFARKKYLKLKSFVIKIQSMARCYQLSKLYQQKLKSILKLQSFGRMIILYREYNLKYISVVIIQSFFRMFLSQYHYLKIVDAVSRFQSKVLSIQLSNSYRIKRESIIKIQSFGRMIVKRRLFAEATISAIAIQSVVRSYLCRHRFSKTYYKIIIVQSIIRRFIAKHGTRRMLTAVKKIQSFGRMIVTRQRYMIDLISIIMVQSLARRFLCRFRFIKNIFQIIIIQKCLRGYLTRLQLGKEIYSAIIIQSFGRMLIQKKMFIRKLVSIICIQSLVRTRLAVLLRIKMNFKLILIQSVARMYLERMRFKKSIKKVNKIISILRMFKEKRIFRIELVRICRIQKAIRAFLANCQLKNRIIEIHDLCSSPNHSLDKIQLHFKEYPQDLFIRNRYSDLCTIVQSILKSGNISSLDYFQMGFKGLFDIDARGQISSHFCCYNANFDMLISLNKILNTYTPQKRTDFGIIDEDDDDQNTGNSVTATNNAELRQILARSVKLNQLKKGYLKKKRGNFMWQKRWVVLTYDYIIYYKNEQSTQNPKFAIPLLGCSVDRVASAKDPIIELQSPNMADKKSIFGSSKKKSISFMFDSEKDLQEWLMPLKAVAGIDTLRSDASTPVDYIQIELRQKYLSHRTIDLMSPLHILAQNVLLSIEEVEFSCTLSIKKIIQRQVEAIKVASWIIENGSCPINCQDIAGETPLHIYFASLCEFFDILSNVSEDNTSIISNNKDTIVKSTFFFPVCLLLKGADLASIKNAKGMTPSEIIFQYCSKKTELSQALALFYSFFFDKATKLQISPTMDPLNHNKIKGYSYLNLHFLEYKFSNDTSLSNFDIRLEISVFNSKNDLIEEKYAIDHISYNPFSSIYQGLECGTPDELSTRLIIGGQWQMSTPLENIEDGSYILIELFHIQDDTIQLFKFTRYPIDLQTIDSTYGMKIPITSSNTVSIATTSSPNQYIDSPSRSSFNDDRLSNSFNGYISFDIIIYRKNKSLEFDEDLKFLLK